MPDDQVAPLAGAWIETWCQTGSPRHSVVAPLAGAWIETSESANSCLSASVAPLAGAWIETSPRIALWDYPRSRPSRRGVD